MMGEPAGDYGATQASLYLYVRDTDEIYRRGLRAGGTSLREPADQFYRDRNAGPARPKCDDVTGTTIWQWAAVFSWDFAGTLVEPLKPERLDQITLIPGVVESIARLSSAGFVCPVVTVQSRIAKGLWSLFSVRSQILCSTTAQLPRID